MAGVLRHTKNKTKRGKGAKIDKFVNIFSTNAAGVKNKLNSLKSSIKQIDAAIVTIQETHSEKKGKIKLEGFEIFEAIRKKRKGGTMIAVHKALEPVLIEEYCEDFELLVVECRMGKKEVRIISGYGPQENLADNERVPFFLALEEEIIKSDMDGKSTIVAMDANSKLGKDLIENDPHDQTPNGKLLADIIDRQNLVILNSLKGKASGNITRKRITSTGTEESIIDFVMISNDIEKDVESFTVDEGRDYGLCKIVKTKKGIKKVESDHNPLIAKFKFPWNKGVKKNRVELYNLKNKECQQHFTKQTSITGILSSFFDSKEDLNQATKAFLKRLDGCITDSFKKIRIKQDNNKEIENLYERRRLLRNMKNKDSIEELKKVEEELADKFSSNNYKKIMEEIEGIEFEGGGINSGKLWSLRRRLCPKSRDPPTAMLDLQGNLVTSPSAIENLSLETYKKRLENRKMKEHLEDIKEKKEKLCMERLKIAANNKTPAWTMDQLEKVLKNLKMNKSRDPSGYANEIFHSDVAGGDLKLAILKMMNRIKDEQKYPTALELCDISSIYKRRGSRNCFDSYRGIFRVSIFRSILDRLIYNDEYETIDNNLTDSNVGARRARNIRDNIFVINAITNSVVNGNEEAVDLQVYDVEKCFDSLWVQECMNDAFEAGLNNDKLPLLFLENLNAQIAVKSFNGKSKRINIKNIIMQGSVWGSLLCTTTMDKLGKVFYDKEELLYKYKGEVSVPALCMVDDIMAVQKCSDKSVEINAVVNAFIELKKLTLSQKKCSKIHVGKKQACCPELKVHNNKMKLSEKEKYLGDTITSSGNIKATIEDRVAKGYGISSEILAIIKEVPLGSYRIEIGLKLRQAMLVNGILYNSEGWHGVSKDQVRALEKVDEHLLRSLFQIHPKAPLEFLYLEAGLVPIRHIISSRRLLFLQTILNRDDTEITKRIYREQQNNPSPGDFVELVSNDLNVVGVPLDENLITNSGRTYKTLIKKQIRIAAFTELLRQQESHSKVRDIIYKTLEPQKYLSSNMFTNDNVSLLAALRSHTVKGIKCNFKTFYQQDTNCPFKCWPPGSPPELDTQEHLLFCTQLNNLNTQQITTDTISYSYIYGDVSQQKAVVSLYQELLTKREHFLDNTLTTNLPVVNWTQAPHSAVQTHSVVGVCIGN